MQVNKLLSMNSDNFKKIKALDNRETSFQFGKHHHSSSYEVFRKVHPKSSFYAPENNSKIIKAKIRQFFNKNGRDSQEIAPNRYENAFKISDSKKSFYLKRLIERREAVSEKPKQKLNETSSNLLKTKLQTADLSALNDWGKRLSPFKFRQEQGKEFNHNFINKKRLKNGKPNAEQYHLQNAILRLTPQINKPFNSNSYQFERATAYVNNFYKSRYISKGEAHSKKSKTPMKIFRQKEQMQPWRKQTENDDDLIFP